MCRSRRERSNEYFLAKFGFDTAENEPYKVCPLSAYRPHRSDGIVDMLEKLKDKFEEERNTCEKEEMEKKHAYQMMMQDLQDEIERATAEKGRKVKSKATREEDAAGFKGDLADTTADKEADEKYLSDMVSWAENKGYEYQ